ncbi:BQ5605_C011g06388 [Microbotryum silenes-dioicae]|uniref:BQ5605_C011g06388 protein n=1 Tax=Microbotryum silenes-dioicae TaxID=796604 RepID=A0A2X0NRQ4_9BASI|nr:BQ5605_C011g06388 [Microbotryum silenes-dioicae]
MRKVDGIIPTWERELAVKGASWSRCRDSSSADVRCSIYDSAAAYQDSWPGAPAQDLSAHPDK